VNLTSLLAGLAGIAAQAWQPLPEGKQTWMLRLNDPGAVVGQAWSSNSPCDVAVPRRSERTKRSRFLGTGAEGYRWRYDWFDRHKPRWTKRFACADAAVTGDGLFVVIAGKRNGQYDEVGLDDDCESHRVPTYVFDRAGKTVLTLPPGQRADQLQAAVLARTGKALVLPPSRRKMPFTVPTIPEEQATHVSARTEFSPDSRMVLVADGHTVRMFRAPQ